MTYLMNRIPNLPLTLSIVGKHFSRRHSALFLQMGEIRMTCLSLFYGEQLSLYLSSAELAHRVVKVNI